MPPTDPKPFTEQAQHQGNGADETPCRPKAAAQDAGRPTQDDDAAQDALMDCYNG